MAMPMHRNGHGMAMAWAWPWHAHGHHDITWLLAWAWPWISSFRPLTLSLIFNLKLGRWRWHKNYLSRWHWDFEWLFIYVIAIIFSIEFTNQLMRRLINLNLVDIGVRHTHSHRQSHTQSQTQTQTQSVNSQVSTTQDQLPTKSKTSMLHIITWLPVRIGVSNRIYFFEACPCISNYRSQLLSILTKVAEFVVQSGHFQHILSLDSSWCQQPSTLAQITFKEYHV